MKKVIKWLAQTMVKVVGETVITLIDLYALLILGLNKLIRTIMWRLICKDESPEMLNFVINFGYKQLIDKLYPDEYSDEEE